MIDRLKTKGGPDDEVLFVLKDPDRFYTHSEVCDIVEQADKLGLLDGDDGMSLDGLTVRQLDDMLRRKQ